MDPVCLSKGEEIHPGGICPCSLLCWGLAESLAQKVVWEVHGPVCVEAGQACSVVILWLCNCSHGAPCHLPMLQAKH